MTKKIVATELPQAIPAEAGSNALMVIINRAVNDSAFDVAKLDHLLQVKERWDKDEARKAFAVALTEFKADPPQIFKNKTVSFKDTKYKHASLDEVSIAIGTSLSKFGLSHRWSVDQSEARIKVTCILMHNSGHSESLAMQCQSDQSGSKNPIQAIGSAVTYLERYTLLAITGMAVQDQDDDGQSAHPQKEPSVSTIAASVLETMVVALNGESVGLITGVFKAKDGRFKIVLKTGAGEREYFTPEEPLAINAKALKMDGDEAKITWTREVDGVFTATAVDRAKVPA